jgi:hypothetical protein
MPGRYDTAGPEAEFQPGSRGRVLRNRLGITSVRESGGSASRIDLGSCLLVASGGCGGEVGDLIDARIEGNGARLI